MRRLIAMMLVLPLVAAAIVRGDDSLIGNSLIEDSLIQRVSLRDLEQNGSRF